MPQLSFGAAPNLTALTVPDLYANLIAPQTNFINGVPSNVAGVVGTATWGPVNTPTVVGGVPDGSALFGPQQPRRYDLMTDVAAAVLQGCNNFRLVRVTDGTDTAASVVALTNCITFTSKYTGSNGNNTTVILGPGSAAGSTKCQVILPPFVTETFDNVTGAGNAFWVNLANAINNGQSPARGPSALITATAGAGVTAPPATATTYNLASGTDGATTITSATLIGVDTLPRKGVYALRGKGCAVAWCAGLADSTQWSTLAAFGTSEGIYTADCSPSGDTISAITTTMASAGVDTPWFKPIFGDWCYFNDTVNNQPQRLIPPTAFAMGQRAALPPHQSGLNKPMYGVVGTQKSLTGGSYSQAELQSLASARVDVIANPCPGGAYYGLRFGRNSSSNPVIHGDNYTTMSDYIGATASAAFGQWVGTLQSASQRRRAKSSISSFFDNLWEQGMIGNADGSIPYSVTLDSTNNPTSQVALGYEQVGIKVQYLSVIEYFVANIEGGQSVQISRVNVASAPQP